MERQGAAGLALRYVCRGYPTVQWRLVHITDTILSSSLPEYTPSLAALFHLRILATAQISPPPASSHHVN